MFTGNRCETIAAPRNGKLDIRSDYSDEMVDGLKSYDLGTTVEILCDEGAELRGEPVLTCEFPGTFTIDKALTFPFDFEEHLAVWVLLKVIHLKHSFLIPLENF